ncbi:MAG: hypothetical protein ABI977_12600 [Acidobacteriota bacterium]
MNLNDLISQAEAARVAVVSRARISQWINDGRLKTYNVGGKPLVSQSQLSRLKRQPIGRPSKKKAKV